MLIKIAEILETIGIAFSLMLWLIFSLGISLFCLIPLAKNLWNQESQQIFRILTSFCLCLTIFVTGVVGIPKATRNQLAHAYCANYGNIAEKVVFQSEKNQQIITQTVFGWIKSSNIELIKEQLKKSDCHNNYPDANN